MARSAATLMIDIAADVAKLRTGFEQAERMVGSFGQKIASIGKTIAVGVAGGAAINSAVARLKAIEADVDRMSDTAENLKLPVAEFQAFEGAALLAGQSMESVGAAIGKFNVFLGKAGEGSKAQVEALDELGIKALDANNNMRPVRELLPEVAKALDGIDDSAKRARLEVEIFGKSGQSISALMSQWAKGTDALNAELTKLGLVHSPEITKQLAANADEADKAKKKFDVLFAAVAAPISTLALDLISGALQSIVNQMKPAAVGFQKEINKAQQALEDFDASVAASNTAGMSTGLTKNQERQRAALEKNLAAMKQINAETLAEFQGMLNVGKGGTGAPTAPKRAPVIDKTPGVDKLAEALKKLRAESVEANSELKALQDRMAAPTTAMERQVELGNVIARRVAETVQGLKDAKLSPTPADIANIEKYITSTETAKSKIKDSAEQMSLAASVQQQWSDGTKTFTELQTNLGTLLKDNRISQDEYNNAMRAGAEVQEEQALQAQRYAEGLDGISAGFTLAMRRMERATSAFAIGEQAFQETFGIMSDAIRDFATTGKLNFESLAQSFADMLARMAAELAAKAAIKLIMSALGSAVSSWSFSGGSTTAGSPAMDSTPVAHGDTGLSWFGRNIGEPFGLIGRRAMGGPVSAGQPYWVGENGPEQFVPSIAGNIEPNSGMGAPNIIINNNAPGVDVQTSRTQTGDLLFTIDKVRAALTRDIRRGGNPMSVALGQAYGVARTGR